MLYCCRGCSDLILPNRKIDEKSKIDKKKQANDLIRLQQDLAQTQGDMLVVDAKQKPANALRGLQEEVEEEGSEGEN